MMTNLFITKTAATTEPIVIIQTARAQSPTRNKNSASQRAPRMKTNCITFVVHSIYQQKDE